MGRPKKELKRIHRKKIRSAKKKVQASLKGETPQNALSSLAKGMLKKRKRSEGKSA